VLYTTLTPNGNGNVPHVRGRGLRRRKMTSEQRVKLGADLVSGCLQLEPSLAQVSELVRVPQAKIRDELKARAAACETERHLPVTALIEAWDRAAEHEREAAVRSIGVAEVWEILARVVA
jgi:hypothetical protein